MSDTDREREIFERVLEEREEAREALLRELCGEDEELLGRLQQLLSAHRRAQHLPTEHSPESRLEMNQEHPGEIGPYKILERIGKGGMGSVYLAEQTHPLRRRVALKVIKAGMDTQEVIARFHAERQALALMNHPNISRILDTGATEQGRPYFVMEYVPGIPLLEYCDRHQLEIEERLDLFIQVCMAVQHAHQKGVIHRDIKPSNVLVMEEGDRLLPKVIDFGIAKAIGQRLSDLTVHTELGRLMGTPEYMSPEQAKMSGLDVDTRADVYSLGAMLYELLLGTRPFDFSDPDMDLAEIQRVIREQDPLTPSARLNQGGEAADRWAERRRTDTPELARRLRDDLDWITMKALEKNRARRYSSASELAADIRRHLAGEPVTARPPSARYRLGKFVQRHFTLLMACGVAALALVGGIIGTTMGLLEARREAERAQVQARIAEAVNEFLNDDLLSAVAPSEQGIDVTMREVLDVAAQRIEGRFEDQPLVEARLQTTLGVTYRELGEFDSAEVQLQRALATRRRLLGDDAAGTLESRRELAQLDYARGRYDDAERAFTTILDVRRRTLGAEDPSSLASVNDLVSTYIMQQRDDEAVPLLEEALQIIRRIPDRDPGISMRLTAHLGMVYQGLGRYQDAAPLLVEVLDASKQYYGEMHLETLSSMQNLASLYRQTGRYDEAESLYATSAAGARVTFGEEHPSTFRYLANLGLLYSDMGKHDDARKLFEHVLEARRRIIGTENPATLSTAINLALLYNRMELFKDSESLATETFEIASRVLGEEHPYAVISQGVLGMAHLGQGRPGRAESLLAEVIETWKRTRPAGYWRLGVALSQHGAILAALDRFQEAERELLEGYEILATSFSPEHRQVREAIGRLVALYASLDRPDDEASWRSRFVGDAP